MGNYAIVVHGTGSHHNGLRTDADQMAADFVEHLRAKGHNVTSASIVSGGEHDLLDPGSRYPMAGAGR
jgi:uncharacterized protein (DUF2237 family)